MTNAASSSECDESHRIAVSEHFDAAYYSALNPDVQASGLDPLAHFLTIGWRENRNPSRTFDVRYYLATNPDIAAAGINPLLHYAQAGAREGRKPRRPLDTLRRHLEASKAPSVRAADWVGGADRSLPMSYAELLQALEVVLVTAGFVISASHDDYAQNYGGVQNLIADEQRAFERLGWTYLHVSPAAPLPVLADITSAAAFRVAVRLGGERLGIAVFADLVRAVADLRRRGLRVELIIHHLMGHVPEILLHLSEAAATRPIVWVHDFFTLCPNYALMRNDILFCGGPPPSSAACGVCSSGADRVAHLPRVRAFFEACKPSVLAPSAVALDVWCRRGGLSYSEAEILPLARLVMAKEGDAEVDADAERPLRVAHLGGRVLHKGWTVFEDLALRFAGDCRYAFYQLGSSNGPPLPSLIRNVPVRADAEHRDAMIEAVAEHRIDVVVNWSLWPETFCFAVHEALAGGAFVVARAAAGNVWPAVVANAPGQGCTLEDEAALLALFESGAIRTLVSTAARHRGVLLAGNGTADWLLRCRSRSSGETVHGTGSRALPVEKAMLADV